LNPEPQTLMRPFRWQLSLLSTQPRHGFLRGIASEQEACRSALLGDSSSAYHAEPHVGSTIMLLTRSEMGKMPFGEI